MNIKILYLSIVSLFLTNFCWSQVPASEKAALQVFYNDTNGDNWNNTIVNNSVWEFNTPVSNWASIYPSIGWYGVRVDQGITEDHVGILRISNNNLNGILSPELSQLTNLVELTVHGNLSGSIPAEFVQLENLQKLSLGGGFSGEIPIWINQLQNLKELNLGKGLTGNIPVELTQLPVLETLGLTGNNFLDTNIPSFMGNITTLKSLALINNHDGGIPDEFTLLSNLNNLILSGNNLSGTIPDLTNLPLVYLDIRNNKFRFIDFETDFSEYKTNIGDYFIYSPQQNIDDEEILSLPIGTSHDLVMFNAGTYSNNNSYQWYKGVYPNGIKITGATNRIYSLSNISVATAGSYYCLAKNPNISGLTLIRNQISITVGGNSCPIVPNGSVYAEAGKICFGDNKQYNFSGNLTNATYTWNFYDADAETILHSTNEISPNYIYVNNNIAHFQDYIIELIITTEDNCSYGYTHVVTIQDCTPPCAENNPKSEEVKVLFLDLLNHLKGKQINNEVVPEGYNPQELIALSPYITDVNPKIFNFNTIGSTFSFSFSLAHDVDVSIGGWGNNTDYSAGNMDLSNYISSNYSTKTYYYYETSGSQISGRNHYVRHVNFCPETVVQQPCTVTNENSQVVKTLYINLLNHLKNEVLTGNTIPSGYNPLEMQALAPYVTEFSEAKIYSFVSSGGSLSFSFAKSSLKAAPHGVDVEISNWNDNFDFALGDINLSNYLSNTGYTNSSLFYNNTGEEITNHRVRHINFCPDEILTPCNDVVNGNISIVSKGGPGGICIDQSISFVFNSTMQNITNYSWTFVNSNPLYEPSGPTTTNATYTYTAPGSYVIKVEITLDNECTYVIENTIVVNDCSSIPCTENNPKTEVVKGLYISLLNHLKKQHIDGVTISNGYNPVEMQNLAPYVEDVNAKVYNFYANDDYIRFSFVGGSKTHYIDVEVNDWSNNIAYELGGVDLVNYTSSNVYTESAVSYAANGVSIPGHKVRHINFCPDEIVAPCDDVVAGNIVVNSKAQIVEYCINDTYAFKFNTTTLQNITNYSWTFYDTDGITELNVVSGPILAFPQYTYTTAGTYNIKLVVTLDNGCTYEFENTFVISDCLPPSCTENNPNSDVVEGLFVDFLQHLVGKLNNNEIIPEGYTSLELDLLKPYITDLPSASIGIYNIHTYYSSYEGNPALGELRFSFLPNEEEHDIILKGSIFPIPAANFDLNLTSYTSSNNHMDLSGYDYTQQWVGGDEIVVFIFKDFLVRHINFCPDEIVAPCDDVVAGNIVVNSKTQIVEYCINDTYAFKFNTTTLQNITNYSWTFYDTDGITELNVVSGPILAFPQYTYTTAGTYNIKLVVTLDNGCTYEFENTFIISDCLPPSCTENNPNSDYVGGLVINLIDYLINELQNGANASTLNGTTPPPLGQLLPYITDTDKGVINNFQFLSSTDEITGFEFSFSPSHNDFDIRFRHPYAAPLSSSEPVPSTSSIIMDLSNYTNPESLITLDGGQFIDLSVRHINFCPDEIVDPCVNPISGVIANTVNAQQFCSGAAYDFALLNSNSNISSYNWSLTYLFQFGPFSFPFSVDFLLNNVNDEQQQITFPFQGNYILNLSVTDVYGCTEDFSLPIAVGPFCDPCITSTISGEIITEIPTEEYCSGTDIDFSFSTTNTNITGYEWSLTETIMNGPFPVVTLIPLFDVDIQSQSFNYVFSEQGNYTVNLVVTDVNGCTQNFSFPISITNCVPSCIDNLQGTITANTIQYCLGTDYSFYIQTSVGIDAFEWSLTQQQFVGGVLVQVPLLFPNPNNQTLDFSFLDVGIYTVSVTIRYNDVCEETFSLRIRVTNCGPTSCTASNPNSEVVEDLVVNLVQHVLDRIQNGDPATDIDGSAPQELLDLLPYISDTDKGDINNFTTDYSGTFSFSFSLTDTDADITFMADDLSNVNITGIDLNTASYVDENTPITFNQAPLFNQLSLQHVNLCPDELVASCLKSSNNFSGEIRGLFMELIDVLVEDHRSSDTGTLTNINPPELIELAPYIISTDVYPRIYNFAYNSTAAEYTFSFSNEHPEEEYDVKVKVKKEFGEGTPIGGTVTSLYNFGFDSNPEEYSNFDLDWENDDVTTTKNQVRHINFCSEEINRCDVHVAIIVDESGSLTNSGPIAENEKKQIRKGLLDLVTRLYDTNSDTQISITGMADSDNYNRADAIPPQTINDANFATYESWIRNYGFRYDQTGISGSSDFWAGALNKVKSYGDANPDDVPEIVIIITDGAQTDNAVELQNVLAHFRTESNVYVYGVDNTSYISDDVASNLGGRLAESQDPNIHPELSNYREASTTTTANARNITPSLFTSLSYLYGGGYVPEMSAIDLLTADYYPYQNFLGLSRGLTPLFNLLIHSGIGCGVPFELCDACDSFKPIPGNEYWISAWVKEDLNVQVKTYTNAAVNIRFLDTVDEEIPIDSSDPNATPTRFKASGNIIDGWQRVIGKFKVPKEPISAVTMKIDLVNESVNIPVYFDDVRVHPINGNMKSFVYDPVTLRLMAELDENNFSTRYNYDKEGGLIRVKKETAKGIKTIQETRSGSVIKPQN